MFQRNSLKKCKHLIFEMISCSMERGLHIDSLKLHKMLIQAYAYNNYSSLIKSKFQCFRSTHDVTHTITQIPTGPIIEANQVTLTCTIQGGNPVATIMWSCDGAIKIAPTGSPSTEDVISGVELVASKNNNGQICTCTGRHILWTNNKMLQHTITVYC